jgi:hypothetical protein
MFVIFKELPKGNNRPMSENSPNLVTLIPIEPNQAEPSSKRGKGPTWVLRLVMKIVFNRMPQKHVYTKLGL